MEYWIVIPDTAICVFQIQESTCSSSHYHLMAFPTVQGRVLTLPSRVLTQDRSGKWQIKPSRSPPWDSRCWKGQHASQKLKMKGCSCAGPPSSPPVEAEVLRHPQASVRKAPTVKAHSQVGTSKVATWASGFPLCVSATSPVKWRYYSYLEGLLLCSLT